MPEDDVCKPLVETRLLTIRQEGERTTYKFAHERAHRYLVARYLTRRDPKLMGDWHRELNPEKGLGRAYWSDVIDFWGAMKAEQPRGTKENYRDFLKDVARFDSAIFAERLYPQYERFRDRGEIAEDPLFERCAASHLAQAVVHAA